MMAASTRAAESMGGITMTHERKSEKTAMPREKRPPEHQQPGDEGLGRVRQPQREREVGRGLEEATPQR
jgi:hypothetical protein